MVKKVRKKKQKKDALVVKRRGHRETFDERKTYGSVYAACASAHYSERRCEIVANEITRKIKKLAKTRKEIRATEIHRKVLGELKKKNEELAFFYEHHLPNLKKL